ncbi:3-dehydroquinate synthase [Aestuariivivens sediminicola]|uniref:3-dehydroquinate synthase n=1 Tax=Aestuariivivens sediminicola TaxID=2913560 RepID=UPI001F5935B6|nr:3-dehydroquinate synthase [Aestuariivivens sediminicola]
MDPIRANNSTIYFDSAGYTSLNDYIEKGKFSKIFILVDDNTHVHCLPSFLTHLNTNTSIEILEIEAGEIHKTIETCSGVWNSLSELDADRKSLLINLGGGVITDLGGFVACTFKRGIKYINIPTTLLAMVDASVGGKTGVDLGHLKNQIGVISSPDIIIIDTSYLNTLPKHQMKSGMAEMFKHGLISDSNYWKKLSDLSRLTIEDLDGLIYESVLIKKCVVDKDPDEQNLRKTLNYGHTLGHAIESYFLSNTNRPSLLHGEAVAIGTVMASYISTQLAGLPEEDTHEIKSVLKSFYGHIPIAENEYKAIMDLLKYDKKNVHGNINFVLLEAIGSPKIDCIVPDEIIREAFKYYAA